MISIRRIVEHAPRAAGRPLVVLPLAGLLALTLTGCSKLLEVSNPNNVSASDLQQPVSAEAQANGALATVARGVSYVSAVINDVGDEITQGGSRDAWRQLTFGNLDDYTNEYSNAAWPSIMRGRYMADLAISNLAKFESDKTLSNVDDLTRSYLYGAIVYDRIADWYENAVVGSEGTKAAPPVGAANMVNLYDTALGYVSKGMTLAQQEGNQERELELAAMKAQILYHKAVWSQLHPPGTTPANPLMDDAATVTAAKAFFALNPSPDWMYRFQYSVNTVTNYLAESTNENIYTIVCPCIATMDASGKHPEAPWTNVDDPIDHIPDPALAQAIQEFATARGYAPLTIVSAREMHLILAEAALASGDNATFDTQINDVRSLYKNLTPYTGQIPGQAMLIHERRVNMFLQGFRLSDMYRFGIKSPDWLSTTAAYTKPGTFLPIAYIEKLSNCYVNGSCTK